MEWISAVWYRGSLHMRSLREVPNRKWKFSNHRKSRNNPENFQLWGSSLRCIFCFSFNQIFYKLLQKNLLKLPNRPKFKAKAKKSKNNFIPKNFKFIPLSKVFDLTERNPDLGGPDDRGSRHRDKRRAGDGWGTVESSQSLEEAVRRKYLWGWS